MGINIVADKHIHGRVLLEYAKKIASLKNVYDAYENYRKKVDSYTVLDEKTILEIVEALNDYRRVAIPMFDSMKNSGQTGLGSSIMEEFFYLLFNIKVKEMHINHDNLFVGKGNSYVSLSFTPNNFDSVFEKPNAYIHTKDQDFVLGVNIGIEVTADGTADKKMTVIPVVAIECKTYLERNMLDSCAATAARLKSAMPYCVYIVASEYMKMDDATPELTDIDEVYILCKAKNSDREKRRDHNQEPFEIDGDLIVDLYNRVDRHLKAIWWNPDDAVSNGKIINRPN
ncbi:Bpu10I family restriction endonuclease [Butyrivibrio sp. AD3002]|uniref:Bpu10I family restriction endonuclease n=1 Tax=Butyrivibrio sp. AD3002 TaxID=1280670 RepID=UPI0003B4BDA8|nr:Bpu10I family restriction endonuclease [Butyrivibrio sp. AD3002]